MSIPLEACQWRRWSQICLSQEICRSIEMGLAIQMYCFPGFVVVFSFCLFATICFWPVSSSLLLFCSLFSCICCSLFVVCVSVLLWWNGWNIWLQWKWDLSCALNGDSWGVFPPCPRIVSFSYCVFSGISHASLERETGMSSWKRMVKTRTSFWG